MSDLQITIQNFFDRWHEILGRALEHWSKHSNRRTILTLIVGGVIITWGYIALVQAPDDFPINSLVTIENGATLSDAADQLETQHAIRSSLALKLFIKLLGRENTVHAGDYLFKEPLDVFTVARDVVNGAFGLEPTRFRIPEGASVKKMASIYKASLQRFNVDRFLENALPQEGYLFPDTYFFLPNADDQLVLQTMRQNFDAKIASIQKQMDAFGKPLSDIVTMASIIEREAENTTDRRLISGVLWNRIKRGMLLQVDVTFAYTLGKGSFQLTKKDLATDEPYNTYVHKGLPPGPIGAPSLDSLLAAVTPTKTNYLFYLADSRHVTHYSATYAEHLRLKQLYIGN